MISIVPASPAHVGVIANRMRDCDVRECAALGHSPKGALRHGLKVGYEVWTARHDGRPEAMFGLTVTSALGGEAIPWMLGTDEIYRHPREMIRWGESLVKRWLDSFPHLENLVSVENAAAIRMLRRWGFTIGKDVIASGGVDFVPFTMER